MSVVTKRTYAVIGGDARQEYLAQLLRADGCPTVTFGLSDTSADVSLTEAVSAHRVILPLPLSKETGLLHCRERVELEDLWQMLRPDQLVCGGQIGDAMAAAMAHGITPVDYFQREELTVANAVPTALAVGHRETGMRFLSTFAYWVATGHRQLLSILSAPARIHIEAAI